MEKNNLKSQVRAFSDHRNMHEVTQAISLARQNKFKDRLFQTAVDFCDSV